MRLVEEAMKILEAIESGSNYQSFNLQKFAEEHAHILYNADQGWGDEAKWAEAELPTIETAIKKKFGSGTLAKIIELSNLNLALAEYLGGQDAKEAQSEFNALCKKLNIKPF